jgi:glucuronoarabinoxylan endo-1,4-beta-xylanase
VNSPLKHSRQILRRTLGFLLLVSLSEALQAQSKPILIQPEVQYQRLDGFGVTIGNGSAKELMALPLTERTKLLDLVFGADGARANIVRSEVSWKGQRLKMTHPLYLRGFMYYFADEESETAQFNLLREALKRSEVFWNACVWSPPPQWKSSQSTEGEGELLPKHYEDFATYLAAYVEFYKKLRFQDVHALSLQNAPVKAQAGIGCLWNAGQFKEFLKVVGKVFKERGIVTKIMLPDLGWDELNPFLQPILEDPEARSLVSHLSAHSLEAEGAGHSLAKETCKRQNFRLWQTEFALPAIEESAGIAGGLKLATHILNDLTQAETQAWLYWTLLPPAGWSGRLGLLDQAGSSFQASKRFWSFVQFSKFLPRNSVRISARGGSSSYVAFRNPQYNGITVIFTNSSQQPTEETLELRGWNLERRMAYRTSDKEDCATVPLPAESGSKITLTLEPRSITTFVAQIRRVH